MLTHEITDCIERLRGLQQGLAAIIDSQVHVDIGAVVFLTTELKHAIEDLDHRLPNSNDLKPEAIERVASFPGKIEGEG